ncbi:MAG: TIGR00153 family protein [Gammaproteobacteria bacterium]|nr:TIGR00153 family protein [Gammaproteobacteria bacterium]
MALSPFTNLFGRSPFTALQKHMRAVIDCVEVVPELFDALCKDDHARLVAAQERIFALENEADKVKNELREHLPKSLFLPVDRRDLLDILDMQDSIADTAQDIAGLLVERPMTLVDPMRAPLTELVALCVETCHQAHKVIEELDELLEMGFGGKERGDVLEMIAELGRLEDRTDELGIELTRLLFRHEDELKPVTVMFWYQLIEWIGDLADYAEKVGNRLRLILAVR